MIQTWLQIAMHRGSWTMHSGYSKLKLCRIRSTIECQLSNLVIPLLVDQLWHFCTFYVRLEADISKNLLQIAHHMPAEMRLSSVLEAMVWLVANNWGRLTSSAVESMSNYSFRRVWAFPVLFVIEMGWVPYQLRLQSLIWRRSMWRLAIRHSKEWISKEGRFTLTKTCNGFPFKGTLLGTKFWLRIGIADGLTCELGTIKRKTGESDECAF